MPEPWIKLKIGMRRSDKLGDLPSDSARLGYIYTLLEAKVQRRMGTFVNRRAFADVLGAYGKFFVEYVKRGLLHVAPLQCVECATRHGELIAGTVVVHDFLREQRDPTNAERQDLWRNSQPNGPGNAGPNTGPNTGPNASSNAGTPPDRNAPLAPARAYAGDDRDSDSERTSFREVTSRERADVQALLDRGWARITAKQRAVLDEVLGRHDVTGPDWAALIIHATPAEADPLDAVKRADSAWQADRRDRILREETVWKAEKAAERSRAAMAHAEIEAGLR